MTPEPWHWWALGGLLVLLEAAVPGFVLIWLGLAALVTGGALWLVPGLAWPWQVSLFSALTLLTVAGWFHWRGHASVAPGRASLNRRAQSYVGQVVTVAEPIVGGRGKVRIGDTVWIASGPDLPAGRRARVVAARGTLLEVEAARDDP